MRQSIKSVSSKPQKFVPKGHAQFDENAKDIKDRPLVIMGRPLNREDRYNMSSLMEVRSKQNSSGEDERYVANLGTISKYVWANCALEVLNVVSEDGDKEVVKGFEKDRLFDARELEGEIAEFIAWVQEISRFDETESKN